MQKKLLTIEEAKQVTGWGKTFLNAMLMRGEIRSIKIGRTRRIPIEALDEFIARKLSEQE